MLRDNDQKFSTLQSLSYINFQYINQLLN